jgi:uncharacterized protein (DUF2147 family)
MKWIAIVAGCVGLFAPVSLGAQAAGVLGQWKDPLGSVLRIDRCGAQVCIWILSLRRAAPAMDIHNPEPGERGHALCGMKIGSGFNLRDSNHAAGGTLYDPKTGKTYHGAMTADGSKLELRGYVGIPLFGASQTWTRLAEPVKPCSVGEPGK